MSAPTTKPRKRRAALKSSEPTLVRIADLVRTARAREGLTQEQLAELSNTGLRFIKELELAKPTLALGKVVTVLETLGYTLGAQRMQAT